MRGDGAAERDFGCQMEGGGGGRVGEGGERSGKESERGEVSAGQPCVIEEAAAAAEVRELHAADTDGDGRRERLEVGRVVGLIVCPAEFDLLLDDIAAELA